jgi:Hemopexin
MIGMATKWTPDGQKLIADEWQGMAAAGFASGLDAAVNWGDGKAYFFKGNKYLRYDIAGDKVDAGWPKLIADEWQGMAAAGFASGLDAAVTGEMVRLTFSKAISI